MTTMLLDDYESEADYDSEAEDYEADYDSEGEDSEDARSDAIRRRRAAQARRVRAQRRMAQNRARRAARPVPKPSTPATPRQTVAAIRNLDLETKVGEDSLRSAIEQANRRAARATYATVASVAIDQAFDTFGADLDGHEFVRAGLRVAPLMLLSPQRRRPGVEGVLLDPRFIGAAAVAGLLTVSQIRDRDDDVEAIEIDQKELDSGVTDGQLQAVAVNKKGGDTGREVDWSASNQAVLTLRKDGTFNIPKPVDRDTTVRVTAKAGGTSKTVFLRLTPPAGKTAVFAAAAGGGNQPAKKAAAGGGNQPAKKAAAPGQ